MKQLFIALTILTPLLFFASGHVFSQGNTCEEIIEAAMQSTDEQCIALGDNQACYGHDLVQALSQSDASTFSFAEPGDLADLVELHSLRVSALDVEAGYWGIALMQLLAQLPDANPEAVSMLVFGDVELENNVSSPAQINVEIQGNIGVHVRERPFPSSQSIIQVRPGQTVIANARLADSSWFRIELPESGRFGWINADLINSDEDLTTLPVIEAQTPHFGPLQAFRLGTGVESGSACDSAPPDGLLVQTPEGIAEVTFLVNEVNIQLRATAFLQAQAGHEMIVAVLNGQARVEALGVTRSVPAGMMTRVALDEDGVPTAPPTEPEPYRSVILGVKRLVGLLPGRATATGNVGTLEEQLEPAEVNLPTEQSDAPLLATDTPPEPTAIPPNPNQNSQSSDSSGGGGGSDGGGSGGPPGGGGGPPGGGGGPPG